MNDVDSLRRKMPIPLACQSQTYAYDAGGNLVTITSTDGTNTYVQTLTYDASNRMTARSAWVKQ